MRKVNNLAQQLLNVAHQQQDEDLLLQAHHAVWSTLIFSGELTLAMEHINAGHALYRSQEHHAQAFLYGGHDPGACCRNMSAWCLWLLGYPDQALQWSDEALTLAMQLRDPQTLAHTLFWNAPLHHLLRDSRTLARRVEALGALATEQAFLSYLADVDVLRGWVLAQGGQQEEGVARMRRGLAARLGPSTGTMYIQPYLTSLLAEARADRDEASGALGLLLQALERVNQTEERWFEAELHRLKGEVLLKLPQTDPVQAEDCFRMAMAVAQGQRAKSLELRAATSLSRLWAEQGRRAEARDLLAPVYDWFTEGFDTLDLKDARKLLDELS
jgi:predicted ATPase